MVRTRFKCGICGKDYTQAEMCNYGRGWRCRECFEEEA